MKSESKKNNKFDKLNVTLYIPENLSSITVDAYAFKNSNFFYLIGIGSNASCKLSVSEVCTFNSVEFNNIELIKKDTTEIDLAELKLRKVLFTGFDKASKYFGGKLDSDLLSTRYITLLFEHVTIHCNETGEFEKNYRIDGAIYAKDIMFTSFLENSTVFQFGDQMIITPVSTVRGCRRTCIQPYTPGKNVSITVRNDNPKSILTIGSWFSSKCAMFTPLHLEIIDSYLTILDGNWNDQENFKITLQRAHLHIKIDGPRISLENNTFDSTITTSKDSLKFLSLNLKNINNIEFKDIENVSVIDLYASNNSRIGNGVKQMFCRYVHSVPKEKEEEVIEYDDKYNEGGDEKKEEGVTFTVESETLIINTVDQTVKQINCNELVVPNKGKIDGIHHNGVLYFIHDSERIPKIVCKQMTSINETLKINVQPAGENDVLPDANITLVQSNKTIKAETISLIWDYKEVPDKSVGQNIEIKSDDIVEVNSQQYICLSTDSGDCGLTDNYIIRTQNNLKDLAENLSITENSSRAVKLKIYLDDDFENFEINYGIKFRGIKINSELNQENKVTFTIGADTKPGFNIQLKSVTADIPEETKIDTLKMTNVKIVRKDVKLTNVNYIELDTETNDEFTYPLHPANSTIINTETVEISGENLKPKVFTDFGEKQEMKIKFRGVKKITKKGAPFPNKINIGIEVEDAVTLESNNFGSMLTFEIGGIPGENNDIVVNFKAVLPAKIIDGNFKSMTLKPNFLGNTFNYQNQLCGKNITLETTGIVNISKKTLYCKSESMLFITTATIAKDPMFQGVINLRQLTIERMMELTSNTYLHIDEYANPDDDFLLHYNWSLKHFPTVKISKFVKVQKTSFTPGIQTFADQNDEDIEFMKQNLDIFKFGMPFICIDDSNYRGNLFNEGMVFRNGTLNNSLISTAMRIGPSNAVSQCAYMLLFNPKEDKIYEVQASPVKGPINKAHFKALITLSSLLLVFLCAFSIYMLFFQRRRAPKKEITHSESRSVVMEDLL
ncbi:hypothetical protein TVAG_350610 [Trichomonas vaginalis G3]|uniref:Uncharacterized protein n=1 Tax=Trichomonas vaginalis (strain ATCC PRA-98 / G3) TaxID=412133 RepID=A2ESK6_TRIV3|nr:hypothetical protein TVAGG3_0034980 [Trichomonas vaginalis G3]EAY04386.1 hypothetical protein TVAG_350610 [Trichomonas vaginalis G3]KAI5540319.1 hypothetical protein TVAGG3_0034980 [Trichomonas vaginalis G3]|eukprot:XP_001316609.1 hypothetical protein [Trichomonas vaginalis G3]